MPTHQIRTTIPGRIKVRKFIGGSEEHTIILPHALLEFRRADRTEPYHLDWPRITLARHGKEEEVRIERDPLTSPGEKWLGRDAETYRSLVSYAQRSCREAKTSPGLKHDLLKILSTGMSELDTAFRLIALIFAPRLNSQFTCEATAFSTITIKQPTGSTNKILFSIPTFHVGRRDDALISDLSVTFTPTSARLCIVEDDGGSVRKFGNESLAAYARFTVQTGVSTFNKENQGAIIQALNDGTNSVFAALERYAREVTDQADPGAPS